MVKITKGDCRCTSCNQKHESNKQIELGTSMMATVTLCASCLSKLMKSALTPIKKTKSVSPIVIHFSEIGYQIDILNRAQFNEIYDQLKIEARECRDYWEDINPRKAANSLIDFVRNYSK